MREVLIYIDRDFDKKVERGFVPLTITPIGVIEVDNANLKPMQNNWHPVEKFVWIPEKQL